jgi:hypothetical protein
MWISARASECAKDVMCVPPHLAHAFDPLALEPPCS